MFEGLEYFIAIRSILGSTELPMYTSVVFSFFFFLFTSLPPQYSSISACIGTWSIYECIVYIWEKLYSVALIISCISPLTLIHIIQSSKHGGDKPPNIREGLAQLPMVRSNQVLTFYSQGFADLPVQKQKIATTICRITS